LALSLGVLCCFCLSRAETAALQSVPSVVGGASNWASGVPSAIQLGGGPERILISQTEEPTRASRAPSQRPTRRPSRAPSQNPTSRPPRARAEDSGDGAGAGAGGTPVNEDEASMPSADDEASMPSADDETVGRDSFEAPETSDEIVSKPSNSVASECVLCASVCRQAVERSH
jgi:hypothetical protein